MAKEEQGTGKHPHKSTEEPWPHHEGKSQQGKSEQGGEQHSRSGSEREEGGSSRSNKGSESSDLKEREYKDEKGEVHHHTRTYEEQHGKK